MPEQSFNPLPTALKLRYSHGSEYQSMFSLAFRTRTRTRRYGIEYEYEYHFIEYEYDKSQNSATSKSNGEGLKHALLKPLGLRTPARKCRPLG
jgi:hypothetical protein